MSEDTTDRQEGTAVTVRPQRQLVANIIPIFDSASFEHYGRIAAVMARSTLVPETLRKGTYDEAVANCFQVVELADRLDFSPFAVAQCASVVNGKLMLEGKFVDAVLQIKLGIELNVYLKGEYGTPDYRAYITDTDLTEEQFDALEPKKHPFAIRMIDGSVKEWRTNNKNWNEQPDMQLGYRGKRTWARKYRPAVMLGILTDDEIDDMQERRLDAPQQQITAGFGDAPKPPRRPRKPASDGAAHDASEPEETSHASAEPHGDPEPAQDAEFEDAGERPTTPAADTATAGARPAEDEPATSESASPAPEASPDLTASSPTEASEPTRAGSVAPRDTIYILSSDDPFASGRLPTYKNGAPFSTVSPDAKALPPAFDVHAPSDAAPGEEPVAEAEFDDTPSEDEGDPISDAIGHVREANTFNAGKAVLKALAATAGYKDIDADRKRGVRLALWKRYSDLREAGAEATEIHADFTLMRLYLEFGLKTEADIDAVWPGFWRHEAFKGANEADRRAISDLMTRRRQELKGPTA